MLQKCTDKWVSSKKLSVQCTSSGLTASRLLPEAKHLHGSTSRVGVPTIQVLHCRVGNTQSYSQHLPVSGNSLSYD